MLAKLKWFKFGVLACVFCSVLIFQSYFVERNEFITYFINYSVLFALFIWFIANYEFKTIVRLSLLAHFLLFYVTPELSNDFYRFLWDGELINMGINPYQFQPHEIIHQVQFQSDYFQELYRGMGELSNNAYSPYPVFNQFFFTLSTYFSDSILVNVICMRIIILIGEILLFIYALKLLELLKKNKRWILLFVLNPFVLLEFTANLHFEIWMLAFFLISFYYLTKGKLIIASFFSAISIQTKLITLLFYPFYWRSTKKKTSILFYFLSGVFSILITLLLFNSSLLIHFFSTIQLYFNKFEFNAGPYFVIREIAYQFRGYNEIAIIGKLMSICIFGLILFLALRKKMNLISSSFFNKLFSALMIYLIFSTTVHPWYILTPFVLSIFAGNFVGLLWTYLIALSYYFYANDYTTSTYVLIAIEWVGIIGFWCFSSKNKEINTYILKQLNLED